MKHNTRFQHESLQDARSVKKLLNALVTGIAKGKIVLEDDEGELVMEPHGLAHLKITASQDARKERLNIRLTWYDEREPEPNKQIRLKAK